MLTAGGKGIFGSDSVGDVLELTAAHNPAFRSVPGVPADHSVPLDAPLPSKLIEDSEVEPRAHQSQLINLPPSHPATL